MTPENAAALRAEFPPEHIGKLPKGKTTLDYCGHGAVTDRLLAVDPLWNWEPLAFDQGQPAFVYDDGGKNPVGLWIRLTVCGVTRLGFGSCPASQIDAEKVLIGDAIRNAAMRFGVALDLWIRGHAEDDERTTAGNQRSRPADAADPEKVANILATVNGLDEDTRGRVRGWVAGKGFPDHPRKLTDPQADQVLAYLESITAQHADQETAP